MNEVGKTSCETQLTVYVSNTPMSDNTKIIAINKKETTDRIQIQTTDTSYSVRYTNVEDKELCALVLTVFATFSGQQTGSFSSWPLSNIRPSELYKRINAFKIALKQKTELEPNKTYQYSIYKADDMKVKTYIQAVMPSHIHIYANEDPEIDMSTQIIATAHTSTIVPLYAKFAGWTKANNLKYIIKVSDTCKPITYRTSPYIVKTKSSDIYDAKSTEILNSLK